MSLIKLFLDTEFTGLHQNTTLISLALVTENDQYFYAEFTDYDKSQLNDWLRTNVMASLTVSENCFDPLNFRIKGDKYEVKTAMKIWLDIILRNKPAGSKILVVGDVMHYDWVLFCEIFGGAFDIPSTILNYPIDASVLFHFVEGDMEKERYKYVEAELTEQEIGEYKKHHALYDAIILKKCYSKLINKAKT